MTYFTRTRTLILASIAGIAVVRNSDCAEPLSVPPAPALMIAEAHASLPHQFLGSQSCASASCHGAPARTDLPASAAHFYFDRDPHTQAGTSLYERRSVEMVKRLGYSAPPWQVQECLSCHAPGALNANSRLSSELAVVDGVGCEACHGPAHDWITAHRSSAWNDLSVWTAGRKSEAGFVATKDLSVRAGLCADCHIGNGTQQVTHDLIAAGHPRLTYEFTAYHDMLPAHWDRRKDEQRLSAKEPIPSSIYTKAWVLGQLLNADRQLDQVVANAMDRSHPWPDLAQFDCFACHHDLADPSWRQSHASENLRPGRATWGSWTLGLVSELPSEATRLNQAEFKDQEISLRKMLENYSQDRLQIRTLATALRDDLQKSTELINTQFWQGPQSQEMLLDLMRRDLSKNGRWDRNVQLYLSLAAIASRDDSATNADRLLLDSIRKGLSFRRDSVTGEFDSPAFSNGLKEVRKRSQIVELFEQYRNLLESPDS